MYSVQVCVPVNNVSVDPCSCLLQSDRFQSGVSADLSRSKAQTSSPSTGFLPLSSFQPRQKPRPPSGQLLSTQAEGDLLLDALRQYLSGRPPLRSGGVSPGGAQEEDASLLRLRPFYANWIENPGLRKESSKSRLLKMGRTQGASVRDPLTSVDGVWI